MELPAGSEEALTGLRDRVAQQCNALANMAGRQPQSIMGAPLVLDGPDRAAAVGDAYARNLSLFTDGSPAPAVDQKEIPKTADLFADLLGARRTVFDIQGALQERQARTQEQRQEQAPASAGPALGGSSSSSQ